MSGGIFLGTPLICFMEKAFLSELLVTTYKTTGYNKQKFTICALAKVKI